MLVGGEKEGKNETGLGLCWICPVGKTCVQEGSVVFEVGGGEQWKGEKGRSRKKKKARSGYILYFLHAWLDMLQRLKRF